MRSSRQPLRRPREFQLATTGIADNRPVDGDGRRRWFQQRLATVGVAAAIVCLVASGCNGPVDKAGELYLSQHAR